MLNRKRVGRKRKRNNRGSQRNYQLARAGGYTAREKMRLTWLDPHRYVTLRYTETIATTLATVTAVAQVFNLNSVFAPNRTGGATAHQAYGFDQLSPLYNRYRVLRTLWRCVFAPSSLAYHLCVFPLNALLSVAPTTAILFDVACEQQQAQVWDQGSSGQSKMITGEIALNQLAGTTRAEYLADDRYEANVGASPAEVMVLYIVLYNPNASSITMQYSVELEFEVDFHDPTSQPGS
jgi:hypothetical protein